jgi:hypothetical protein
MAKTYEPIATTTLGSAAATVTFSSISGAYTDLIVVANLAQSAGSNSLRFRLNGDTGSNYSATILRGYGSTANSVIDTSTTSGYACDTPGNTSFNLMCIFHIMNYSNTTTYKTTLGRGSNAATETDAAVNLWRNTAAVTSVQFALGSTFPSNNIASGSTFTLYGIKAA